MQITLKDLRTCISEEVNSFNSYTKTYNVVLASLNKLKEVKNIKEFKTAINEETRIYNAYTRAYKRLLDSLIELRDVHGLSPKKILRQALMQINTEY